jgi:galactitol-specific phosphotransferase system IIB component
MIKIQPIVREIVLKELEAYIALTEGYMNMSSYAHRIRQTVEASAKKKVTITSLVVSLSRLKNEFKKQKPLIQDIVVKNIITRLPLTELVYENSSKFIEEMGTLYKEVSLTREDFFIATVSINEMNIIVSSNMANRVMKHFKAKPKIINNNFAAVGISLSDDSFNTPNTFFSLLSILARARINIEELVSTSTELIFIIAEKDFSETVTLFSKLYKD